MSEKEIGGFFQLETNLGEEYHSAAIRLNSARNCLRYIIRTYKIKRIWAPAYTCPVVWDAIKAEECEIIFYDINEYFLPTKSFPQNDYILYTDYFGVCGKNIELLASKYPNLIVDYSQSFYAKPKGLASFNSPRKFFGVPDGGYLFQKNKLEIQLEKDESISRFSHLIKRIEQGASNAYSDFMREDAMLDDVPIKSMSELTLTLLRGINYSEKRKIRLRNFSYLHSKLQEHNLLQLNLSQVDVPMVYPLLIKKDNLRTKLIGNKIYVATYWKGQKDQNWGKQFENYLLPLPIDQRYSLSDMDFVIKILSDNI